MSRPLTPDPVEVYRLYALTRPALVAITGTDGIGIALQGQGPALRLADVGGTVGPNPGQAVARLQVECWGRGQTGTGPAVDDGTASLLARTVLAELPVDQVTTPAGVITDAWVDGRPFASPDPQTGRARFIVQVRLDLYPTTQ